MQFKNEGPAAGNDCSQICMATRETANIYRGLIHVLKLKEFVRNVRFVSTTAFNDNELSCGRFSLICGCMQYITQKQT